MIDLQKLADMPGYGNAAKVLRAHGMWSECLTDEERVNWIEETDASLKYKYDDDEWTVMSGLCDGSLGQLRPAIDRAALRRNERLYRAHFGGQ